MFMSDIPFEPRIVGFLCNWCSYAGANLAGTSRIQYAPNIRIIRVPCSGRVDPLFVAKAFQEGAASNEDVIKYWNSVKNYPGYFGSFTTETGPAKPNPDRYKGRIVVLTNERTLSQAEFSCMALQASGRSTLIGSQTAGADGDISTLYLPGGITTSFTGMGVHYPDGRPTQGIGIVPDIECRPTIAGIRAGRDEVLERALRFIASGN
jgi:hypothetical protein